VDDDEEAGSITEIRLKFLDSLAVRSPGLYWGVIRSPPMLHGFPSL
jgi:hypothetical protein